MNREVVVIGGGTAGMEAAGQLARNGFRVSLIEKEKEPGGHLSDWYHLFPDRRPGSEVLSILRKNLENKNITLLSGTGINSIERIKNNFSIKTDRGIEIQADAVVVATGFDLFRSEKKEEYGYGIYDNVITSSDLEKKFGSGDLRTTFGMNPRKIGIIHCVGSRDEKSGNLYCSKLCCVTAVKQAIELREKLPDSRVFCFYMDMRMGGAHYEELYMEAQEKHNVSFIRGKVSEVSENIEGSLIIKVEDTLAGRPLRMELDMLVLMAGMEISEGSRKIVNALQLETGENRFLKSRDNHTGNNLGNVPGVFYAGTCTAPMNITETISHARAAVADVIDYFRKEDK
ncbi:MAG TPA: FAD-dependent oxidoreductase [Bacteroidales bacterium]|nr:FAD-dependent oxidoreductase [Bacteroidales bacterium]